MKNKMLALYILILLCILIFPSAHADDMRPASLSVEQLTDTEFLVKWKVPVTASQRLSLEVFFDENVNVVSQPRSQFTNNAHLQEWTISRTNGLQGLSVNIEGFIGNSSDVLVRIIDKNNTVITEVLNIDKPSFTLRSDFHETLQNTILTYLFLGVEHILIGLDHLLFVGCLIYLCSTFGKLLWTITGFTIAHSITLIMAATGVLTIPIAPVEAVIALSIIFLSVEITKQREHSLTLRYPVVVSSSFGLLHGFGFASVLADIGLPGEEKVSALLSFNIGVEIGQLLFVATLLVCFVSLKQLIPSFSLRRIRYLVSYGCGTTASYWLLQRLLNF
jgi:hydrogenase/urease accessory protein HupE